MWSGALTSFDEDCCNEKIGPSDPNDRRVFTADLKHCCKVQGFERKCCGDNNTDTGPLKWHDPPSEASPAIVPPGHHHHDANLHKKHKHEWGDYLSAHNWVRNKAGRTALRYSKELENEAKLFLKEISVCDVDKLNENDILIKIDASNRGANTFAIDGCDECPWHKTVRSWAAETGPVGEASHRASIQSDFITHVGCAENTRNNCIKRVCLYNKKAYSNVTDGLERHNPVTCKDVECCGFKLECRDTAHAHG